jgi:tagatose-6-phosphate ketose/aldose isomerase
MEERSFMGNPGIHPNGAAALEAAGRSALDALAAQATRSATEDRVRELAATTPALATLLTAGEDDARPVGFEHTLHEMAQQPFVWADTALRAASFAEQILGPVLHEQRYRGVVLTGSGSSHYVGELVAPALRAALGLPVFAVAAGDLLTHGAAAFPATGPLLMVSIARSGNSPESLAAVRVAAKEAPATAFLHICCNADGRLAQGTPGDPEAHRLVLHPLTNDRSLVMTSSFTSLALAALSLGYAGRMENYLAEAKRLCDAVLQHQSACAAFAAALDFSSIRRAVFLGSGCQYGAAREAALKLTEMTAGAIVAMAETHLGLRHGPMAAIHADTLLVSLVPPAFRPSRYATDLVAELRAKRLGAGTVLHGSGCAPLLLGDDTQSPNDLPTAGEAFAAIENVTLAQWMGFFASLHHGLSPDAPSRSNVITRVVPPFPIYDAEPDGDAPR